MNSHWKKYRGWGPGGSQAESSVPVHVGAGPCPGGPWVSTTWDAHCMSLWPCRPPSCMSPSRRLIRQCLWSKNELPDSLFELLWHWPIRETEGHLITAGWGRSPDPLSPPLWSPLTLPRLPAPLLTWILFLFKLISNVVLVSVDREVIQLYIYICLLFLYIS